MEPARANHYFWPSKQSKQSKWSKGSKGSKGSMWSKGSKWYNACFGGVMFIR